MKTQLVSAIHLQEVELQEKASERKSRWSHPHPPHHPPPLTEACVSAAEETFTVEEAVETIGFGRFHVLLFLIMGGASVRSADQSRLGSRSQSSSTPSPTLAPPLAPP